MIEGVCGGGGGGGGGGADVPLTAKAEVASGASGSNHSQKGVAKMRMDFEVWRHGMQPNFEEDNLKKIFCWRRGGQEDRHSSGGKFWQEKNPEKAKKDGAETVPDGASCGGK